MSGRTAFTAAVGVLAVHAVDDALINNGPGVGAGQHLAVLAIALAACAAAVAAFGRAGTGLRSLLALALAVPAIANGVTHARHLVQEGPDLADLTGLAALAAGLALLGMACVWLWRARRPGTPKRWAARVLAVPATYLALVFVVMPVGFGIAEVHKGRSDVGDAPAGYTEVAFDATDGVHLSGWYRPSRNGAAVVLAHGGGSTRRGALRHAQMLAGHGYGVLLYDTRGAGESDGPHNSWGWEWDRDVAGALRYVQSRPDVDPRRIGGLGLSSGGDALLAAGDGFAALVTDGAVVRNYEDTRRIGGDSLAPRLMFAMVDLVSNMEAGTPLAVAAERIEAPLLLVSAGRKDEWDASQIYARAAPAAEQFNLPDSTHTAGIRTDRAAYERRVVGFLDAHLVGRRSPGARPQAVRPS